MKYLDKFIVITMALAGAVLTGCQDSFDDPKLEIPVATLKANTTILELKTEYWSDKYNYIDTVKLTAAGEHVVISGRVISNDYTGNIYKNLVIQDETAALAIAVNTTNLSNVYPVGQEVLIDVTDMYIGKYSSLVQLGAPDYSDSYGWQATFMSNDFLKMHTQLNGLPEPSKVDTIPYTIAQLNDQTPTNLIKMQSQLVRFNNVHFEEGGKASYCSAYKTNTKRTLLDENGASLTVYTSGYCDFWSLTLPEGNGDVVGILSYNGSGTSANWQLLLRSTSDVMNFGNPTLPAGTAANPYTVSEAIAMQDSGDTNNYGWVKGYIVGAVKAEVTTVSSASDIEWTAPTEMNNTLVIGATPESKTLDECLIVALAQGSQFREVANLRDNPGMLGRAINVYGTFDTYMGTFGIINNGGTVNEFSIDGVVLPGQDPVTPPSESGVTLLNETFANITGIAQLPGWTIAKTSGNKDWFFREYQNEYAAEMTGYKGTPGANGIVAWLITPALNVDGMTEKLLSFDTQVGYSGGGTLEVYAMSSADPTTATLTKLNATIPAPTGERSAFVNSGNISLEQFNGTIYIGFCYSAVASDNYTTYRVDNVVAGEKAGTGTEPGTDPGTTPVTPPAGGENGSGTEEAPYTCAGIRALNPTTTTAIATGVWAQGYIVGYVDTTVGNSATADNTKFEVGKVASNMLLAPTSDCTDLNQCISLQLPSNSDVRKALNLVDHPDNLGKLVKVQGNVRLYVGIPGIHTPTACILE